MNRQLHNIENILVSRLRFMGDIILTTPLLNALKQAFPQARITYLAEKPYAPLLYNHPDIDQIISLDRTSLRAQLPALKELVHNHYDLAIDLFGNPRSAQLSFLSGAGMRIGGDFRGRKIFYTHKIKDDGQRKTAIEFHLQYLKPLHIAYQQIQPYLCVKEEEEKQARTYLREKSYDLDRPIIGIHPGATWPAKKWFADRFAELAKKITDELHAQVFFTVGPGETGLAESIIQSAALQAPEPEVLNVRQLMSIIKQFQVYVANDCGPMHIAPAVGTRVVGIFGPGEPDIWFPYSQQAGHQLVYRTVDCSCCHRDFCNDLFCMREISVNMAFEAVARALAKSRDLH
jgi:lipopolysaccharide heptosyltransferase II